jgi:hypothetical protein
MGMPKEFVVPLYYPLFSSGEPARASGFLFLHPIGSNLIFGPWILTF